MAGLPVGKFGDHVRRCVSAPLSADLAGRFFCQTLAFPLQALLANKALNGLAAIALVGLFLEQSLIVFLLLRAVRLFAELGSAGRLKARWGQDVFFDQVDIEAGGVPDFSRSRAADLRVAPLKLIHDQLGLRGGGQDRLGARSADPPADHFTECRVVHRFL